MVDLVDRGGAGAALCRPQQCPRGAGMVFRRQRQVEIGVGLAAAAAPVFLAMSLLPECHRWSERALLALDDAQPRRAEEMQLQAALGLSLMFTRGNSEAARVALTRSLAIAEERGDAPYQLRAAGMLHMFHLRASAISRPPCNMRGADPPLPRASRIRPLVALAHSMLGSSLHHVGDLGGARVELEAALQHGPGSQQGASTIYLGFDALQLSAGVALARTLWLQGYPAQAAERARRAVKDAARHGPSGDAVRRPGLGRLRIPLGPAISTAPRSTSDRLISHAESHSLGPYLAVGRGFKGAAGDPPGRCKRRGREPAGLSRSSSTRCATSC